MAAGGLIASSAAAGESALIVVGEPTLDKGLARAIVRANRTAKQDMDAASDELEKELLAAVEK
jgi:hypothetical protein